MLPSKKKESGDGRGLLPASTPYRQRKLMSKGINTYRYHSIVVVYTGTVTTVQPENRFRRNVTCRRLKQSRTTRSWVGWSSRTGNRLRTTFVHCP